MHHPVRNFLLFACVFFVFTVAEASVPYTVKYLGLDDSTALKTIRSVSQLSTLKKRPPDSINAIRYRAESDIPEILKVLHAHGYYEAIVQVRVEEGFNQVVVLVNIQPGPVYTIQNFDISLYEDTPEHPVVCKQVQLKNIGITLGKPMLAQKEMEAELKMLELLSQCGYPLAGIAKREIIVDGDTKTVKVLLEVKTGPLSRFGPVTIQGNTSVKPLYFEQKTEWKQNEEYNSIYVGETQTALMDTGLFSSVLITHGDSLTPDGQIPMHIEVAENKHSSINAGVSYQTYYGPGLTFGWENRNIHGMGQRLSLQGDVTRRSHTGLATYLIPNFGRVNQDYVWQAQAMHVDIIPYSERTYNLTNRVERRIGKRLRISLGAKGERLFVTESAHNGNFWLLGAPIYFGWSSANSILNPTKGIAFQYTGSPTLNLSFNKFPENCFFTNQLTVSHYLPLTKSHVVVFAQKLTIGSILSKTERLIPVSKRFFGGSEEDLRGYTYQTVSPLTHDNKPFGGRSEVFYTFETRFRVSKTIGLVPFFDAGNVYINPLPTMKGKWLKSVGIGLRYFTFIGPFRLDVGFPLNPRKGLDHRYRILVSIGQTF